MTTVALIAAGQAFIAVMMGVDTPLAIVKMGATPFVLGVAYSAWAIGRASTGLVAGYLFDRGSGKQGLLLSFGLLSAVALGYSMLLGPWMMVLLRLFQGASAGIYWTSILSLVGHNVPPIERVRRFAIFNGCVAIGGMAGGISGGWLVSTQGFQLPFWVGGVMALGMVALVAIFLINVRVPHRAKPNLFGHTVDVSEVWPISILGGVSQIPSFLSNAALPLELIRYGLGASALGIENAALVLGNLLGQWVIFHHPGFIYRKASILGLYGVGIIAILGTSDAPNGWTMMVFLALLGTMVNLYSVVWTATIQTQGSDTDTGRATGILRTTGDTMSAASYPLIGWAEHEPGATGIVLASLLGGGMVYYWRRHTFFSKLSILPRTKD